MHDYVQARTLVNSMNTKNISAPIFKVGLKIRHFEKNPRKNAITQG